MTIAAATAQTDHLKAGSAAARPPLKDGDAAQLSFAD
jgi:hypothetical protein